MHIVKYSIIKSLSTDRLLKRQPEGKTFKNVATSFKQGGWRGKGLTIPSQHLLQTCIRDQRQIKKQVGCLPTQGAWNRVICLRDCLFNHWASLLSLMFVMLCLWPQIKAGVALLPQWWCQSKPICPVMKDMIWPNSCQSRGNITEMYGVRPPQLAWETAAIRVQH